MRYYSIVIADPVTGATIKEYTSFPKGVTNPHALDVELDVPVTAFDTPMGNSYVRIWGISLQEISQATDFNPRISSNGTSITAGKIIRIFGGMQKGLPLAISSQSGLLASGVIQQAFGNWIGVDMTLDIIFTAGDVLSTATPNLPVSWLAGTPLATVIGVTLSIAFPQYKQKINISPKLVLNHDEKGFYGNMFQLATYFRQISQAIIGGPYTGVSMVLQDKTFVVTDGTSPTTPKPILFTDLVGQITWLSTATVSITCIMRTDLAVGSYVKLPPGQVTTSAQSFANYRQKSVFQGVFNIVKARHVGRFRNPTGTSWVTIFEAYGPVGASG